MKYSHIIKRSLPAFLGARLAPVLGISAVFLLVAHKNPTDLAIFSYVLAAASVISAFFSLILATTGNRAAALAQDHAAQRDLFAGGFTLALLIAALTAITCLCAMFFISGTSGARHLDTEVFWSLSLIYIASTPLLVINSFLQIFLEATGKAANCANRKILATVTCVGSLGLLFVGASAEAFKYWAMAYFLISELLVLFLLIRLCGHQRYCSSGQARKLSGYFVRTGVPVAAGMSGQKIYFYLLTERLLRIDTHLVAQLSVFMTLVGLLIIPSVALSQIHSLQVSQRIRQSKGFFAAGLTWTLGIMLLSAVALYFLGEYLFFIAGGSIIDYSRRLFLTLIVFLTCSALLSLAMAHLRARHETFVPQLVINTLMLAFLIPGLYHFQFIDPDVETFLLLQSAAVFTGFLLLCGRIFFIHRHDDEAA
ncbi:hypothetical protein ACCD10_30640 [Pseudomonas sp. Pseusp122]|uniref:hypothetical protein n=1 Tax=unclassified Pseudomonas TaxID=196821 RepID=UPI0039A4C07F